MLWLACAMFVAGCGGDDPESPERSERPPDGGGPQTTNVVRDPALGYELRLPEGWEAPTQTQPGQPVAVGGEGRGCVIGTAGTLPDVSSPAELRAFARDVAVERSPNASVVVEPVQGANVAGVAVRISGAGREERSAIFASAGSGVALTCAGRSSDAERLDRGLAQLYESVRLRRDAELEALQPRLASLEGVGGAALRRQQGRVAARLELEDFGVAREVLTSALRVASGELDAPVGISAADPADAGRVAVAQAEPGARSGTVQVAPDPPASVQLR